MKQAYTNTIRGGGSRNPLIIATGSKKGGRGNNNNVGGGKKSSRQNKQQVPKCAYGAACTRKGCAYRHPPRQSTSTDSGPSGMYESYHDDPRSKICKPFLAGLCTYGSKCLNRHPGPEEADVVRAKYKQKSCSYGDECQTEGCLYFHPWEALETTEQHLCTYVDQDVTRMFTGDLCAAVGGLHLESADGTTPKHGVAISAPNAAGSNLQQPTFEQWMALGCPPPADLDNVQLYNMWHYPGNGMQRTPWEAYTLMYPQPHSHTLSTVHANGLLLNANSTLINGNNAATTNLNATPAVIGQTWGTAMGEVANMNAATDTRSNPNNVDTTQQEEPKTFQEWKKKGCPYPSWFYESDQTNDPWYDDEGVRRSLEEVYEVLYTKRKTSSLPDTTVVTQHTDPNFDVNPEMQIGSNPTPSELASIDQTNNFSGTFMAQNQAYPNISTNGGWAGIAAKRPGHNLNANSPIRGLDSGFRSNASGINKRWSDARATSGNSGGIKKHKTVIIPKEVWLPNTANSDYFHMYPNPIERFLAVNAHHKSYLASVTIPTSFEKSISNPNQFSSSRSNNGKVALLDVHFQSAKTVAPVLDHFLTPALQQNDEVWIVTGSGHHVAVGHQSREDKSAKDGKGGNAGSGVLFNAVKRYLDEREEEMGWEIRIGKDASGGKSSIGGAFLVRKGNDRRPAF